MLWEGSSLQMLLIISNEEGALLSAIFLQNIRYDFFSHDFVTLIDLFLFLSPIGWQNRASGNQTKKSNEMFDKKCAKVIHLYTLNVPVSVV